MSASVPVRGECYHSIVFTVVTALPLGIVRRQPLNCVLMETPAHIAAQRIVGGSLALDLLNTQNGPAGGTPEDDALRDYADVVAWGAYVGMLSPEEAERLIRRSRRHPAAARAVFARVIETRGYLYELFRAIATGRNPPPAAIARLQRDEADALAHGELVRIDDAYEWRWADDDLGRPLWPVIHEALAAPDGRRPGSRQGLREVPVPLPRPEQEPQPAVVLDGRLRHRRQDGEVRGAPGVRPIGDRPDLAEQLEAVEVDAAVADGPDRDHMLARRPPGRPEDHAPEPRLRGVEVHRATQHAVDGDRRPPVVPALGGDPGDLAAGEASTWPVAPERGGAAARARRGSRGRQSLDQAPA